MVLQVTNKNVLLETNTQYQKFLEGTNRGTSKKGNRNELGKVYQKFIQVLNGSVFKVTPIHCIMYCGENMGKYQ